jgi:hypothetical protein
MPICGKQLGLKIGVQNAVHLQKWQMMCHLAIQWRSSVFHPLSTNPFMIFRCNMKHDSFICTVYQSVES